MLEKYIAWIIFFRSRLSLNNITKFNLHTHICHTYSLLRIVRGSGYLASHAVKLNAQRIIIVKTYSENVSLSCRVINTILIVCFVTWLYILLLCSGDVHPNPGPTSSASNDSFSSLSSNMSDLLHEMLNQNHHLSFVHYNVQSLLPKIDLLQAELQNFDIIALTETWLHAGIDTEELMLQPFNPPERKDRQTDRHGGVILYIKEGINYRRRHDLETGRVECIWIEITNRQRHILFGVFYRPPEADAEYFTFIEHSVNMATDTGCNNIVITGDFNLNMFKNNSARKINLFCSDFGMHQSITEPTHYTERSEPSLIDLILVHNPDSLVASGVGDPFLEQNLRFHCPIFGLLKFPKTKVKSYTRQIWNYALGNYDLLRAKASETEWDSLRHASLDTYVINFTNHTLQLAKECIPNKLVRIRPADPPWLTSYIKRFICKRKRAYRKAKRTDLAIHWEKFDAKRMHERNKYFEIDALKDTWGKTNGCSLGLRYVSRYKCLIVSLVFSHLGFWSGNLFLIAPFPDLCLLVPFSA